MDDYISRQALIDATDDKYSLGDIGRMERDIIVNALTYASAADVRPVVRGEWIVHRAEDGEEDVECSACGSTPSWHSTPREAAPRYCPWCGAQMGGESDGNDE